MKKSEKQTEVRRDRKKSMKRRVIAMFIIAVGISVYAFRDFVNDFFISNIYDVFVTKINEKITTIPVSIDTTDKIDFDSIDSNYALLSNTRFKVFDKKGNLNFEESIVFSSPVIKSSKNLYLCFERGGKQLFLANNKKVVAKHQSENNIVSANITNNHIIVVYSTKNSTMTAVVYNNKLKEIYKYTTSDYYIQNAIISSNNKIVLALVKSENGLMSTTIKGMTLTSTEPIFTTSIGETVPLSMEFTDNDTVTIISLQKLISLSDKGKMLEQHSFESKSADRFSTLKNSCSAVSFQDFSSNSSYSLSVFSMNGRVLFNQPLKSKAEVVSVYGSRIAVLSSDNLTIFLKNGRKLLDLNFFQNVTKMALKKDKLLLYENDKISYIKI